MFEPGCNRNPQADVEFIHQLVFSFYYNGLFVVGIGQWSLWWLVLWAVLIPLTVSTISDMHP